MNPAAEGTGSAVDSLPAKTQRQRRTPLKSHPEFNNHASWKQKLRESCCQRVRDDRTRLIWSMRLPASPSATDRKDTLKEAFRGIVFDELKRLRDTSADDESKISDFSCKEDEIIWEYDGVHDAYQVDYEEILLEIERIFYEDLKFDPDWKSTGEYTETWEDEEDRYLAQAVLEHMQLNEEQVSKPTWCPICKKGQMQENNSIIFCSSCELKLKRSNEVNLDMLRLRLAEAHADHLDRGCRSKPAFSVETILDFTALYITCPGCDTFDVVV
ncbi:hypothetical protein MLD38_012431 [Melastoma candidum]|uniref:Uncharacterized protein n=1 Tax=Melastoma candidum TaxID=119954 RepID=A0ACB9REQ8_9MYRT|nr:hypothetical protein MLD38_012431 [Melastoma candidum]